MKHKQHTPVTKNTQLFFTTAAFLFVMLVFAGCSELAGNKSKEDSHTTPQTMVSATEQAQALILKEIEAQAQLQPSLSIAIVYDHTKSFAGEVEKLTAELLDPILRYFKARGG